MWRYGKWLLKKKKKEKKKKEKKKKKNVLALPGSIPEIYTLKSASAFQSIYIRLLHIMNMAKLPTGLSAACNTNIQGSIPRQKIWKKKQKMNKFPGNIYRRYRAWESVRKRMREKER
jgi:hypothetical protein